MRVLHEGDHQATPSEGPAIRCATCADGIEGASVWEHMQPHHPWCWHARERAVAHPGLDAAAEDLTRRERATAEG